MTQNNQPKQEVWYGLTENIPKQSGVYLVKKGAYISAALWDDGKWSTLDCFQEIIDDERLDHWALLPRNCREHAALIKEADRLNISAT
jgi:hypothetical protein